MPSNWELRLFTSRELLELNGVIGMPRVESPATRLARSGFEIVAQAEFQSATGQQEINDAYRRRR